MTTCPFCITINDINHINNCQKNDLILLNIRMNTKFIDLYTAIKEYIVFITYDQSLFPFHWEFPQYENLKLIKLTKSKKLTNILQNLNYNKQKSIKEIYQIQNKELFLKFDSIKYLHQSYYTHGSNNVNNIILQGFDNGYSRRGSYGYGIYLAPNINTSLHYNNKEILICNVKLTSNDFQNNYCCVIQNDFQIYPEFLIKFN